jgi:hypothetical protein
MALSGIQRTAQVEAAALVAMIPSLPPVPVVLMVAPTAAVGAEEHGYQRQEAPVVLA